MRKHVSSTALVILSYLKDHLKGYNLNHYGAVVLGCTHFPFFREHIREIFQKGTIIVDGNRGTIQNLKKMLATIGKLHEGSGQVTYYGSGKQVIEGYMMERYLQLLLKIEDGNDGLLFPF